VGARPNFMKIAPLMAAFKHGADPIAAKLIHTGQHYDEAMKQAFFAQLGIPEPDVDLGVGSGTHAVQTAEIMKRFEVVVDGSDPAAVLVVGDVNSTIACALVAAKKGIPVIHVEAGLRSYDRRMPEEVNRVLTDQISDLLFTTERGALDNLIREGIDPERVHFVGNVMIDTLHHNLGRAVSAEAVAERFGLDGVMARSGAAYGVVTLHRPSNVDDPAVFRRLWSTLTEISEDLELVFPIHPRTRDRLEAIKPGGGDGVARLHLLPPLGYLEMLGLVRSAKLVLTDSGGVQEETTALGVPCITLRENTERPITVHEGTNTVVGSDPERIREVVNAVLETGGKAGRVPELWDGKAAIRIRDVIDEWLADDSSLRAAQY
jgi:UDP-N-acetylglucosamine 2-epimerase (non-hydrolysing)